MSLPAVEERKTEASASDGGRMRLMERRKQLHRTIKAWRRSLSERPPSWIRRKLGPTVSYLDMMLVDHGIFRLFYLNRHRLGEKAWRSAQPAPHNIRGLARRGIRTIVNLRGDRPCGSYWLERSACERHGIALVNFKLRSRDAPTREQVKAAQELFETIQYPILMHCKSGADRVGLISVLYRIFREGASVAEAKQELSLRYGHIRQADTGILDRFFESYLEYNARQPISFMEWVDTVYDPVELKRSFRSSGWARRLVDGVLRRE